MAKTETIELIRGTFPASDAREILLRLIDSKIRYHNFKNWNSHERFRKPDPDSEARLKELKESRRRVEVLLSPSDGEKFVEIQSTVHLVLE